MGKLLPYLIVLFITHWVEPAKISAAITSAVTQIAQALNHGQHEAPKPSLRVAAPADLREGPSSKSKRIGVVHTGIMLEEIVLSDRWCYVEVLAGDGSRTGVRGWVYRRKARRVK